MSSIKKFKNQRKTRKYRKTLKRGGHMYSNTKKIYDRNDNFTNYDYNKQSTGTYKLNYNKDWISPSSFIDSLTNVSIAPNNNNNYKYFGMLVMVVKYPNDVSTIKWSLDKYLEDNILPNLLQNNENGVNYTIEHIKINDFKINYNNVDMPTYAFNKTTVNGSFFITGSIYVYDTKKLNIGINKKVYNKLPDEIGNEVKQFIK